MRYLWYLWRMEWRRQRLNLMLLAGGIFLFAIPAFGRFLPVRWTEPMEILFMIAVCLGGVLMALDPFCRDLQSGATRIYFELPVAPWKVFLAKYLFCVALVTATAVIGTKLGPWSRLVMGTEISNFWLAGWSIVLFLLLVHAMLLLCCIAFRGFGGIVATIFLAPVMAAILLPSAIWSAGFWMSPSLTRIYWHWAAYTVAIATVAGVLWVRGIGLSRPMWLVMLKCFAVIAALSLIAGGLFLTIQITEYLTVLSRFENTPGLEIPRGTTPVPRAVWTLKQMPADPAATLKLDFRTSVEIPVADYPEYLRREEMLLQCLNRQINEAAKSKQYDMVLKLLDVYGELPVVVIPQLSRWGNARYEYVFMESSCRVGRFMRQKYMLQLPPADPKRQSYGLVLPFERDTIPVLDGMIARLETIAMRPVVPIRVLPVGQPGEYLGFEEGLRDELPGIDLHGRRRLAAVLRWYCEGDARMPWSQKMLFGFLDPATLSMKLWIAEAAVRQTLIGQTPQRQFELLRRPEATTEKGKKPRWNWAFVQMLDRAPHLRYAAIPALRFRKYLVEHGVYPKTLDEIPGLENLAPMTRYYLPSAKRKTVNPQLVYGTKTKHRNHIGPELIDLYLPNTGAEK